MAATRTAWPDVNQHLAADLRDDLYVQDELRQADPSDPLYVSGGQGARNALRMWLQYDPLDVWIEAQDEDARRLLRLLPADRDLHVKVASPFGLQIVQEELRGTVSVGQVFCFVDRARFRPSLVHRTMPLSRNDEKALAEYPEQWPTDWDRELEGVDAGSDCMFGCWEDGQLVGYATAYSYDGVGQITADVRPEWRGKGYGRSLLSSAIEDRLQRDRCVLCSCCMENIAHLRTAVALGFAPLRQTFYFHGRRRG
ncbi:MAG: GNAT family N-acetyltransferase [Candidatus Brocadiaceae bacterium]|nr:GNAT family N-acetyltransferase [Candidatus Brocadiaceae bacterium]